MSVDAALAVSDEVTQVAPELRRHPTLQPVVPRHAAVVGVELPTPRAGELLTCRHQWLSHMGL